MPFVTREGDCPSVLSRARVSGVHWSEAETLDGGERTEQAQTSGRKGRRYRVIAEKKSLVLQLSRRQCVGTKAAFVGHVVTGLARRLVVWQ
jgi:hypothetical protein